MIIVYHTGHESVHGQETHKSGYSESQPRVAWEQFVGNIEGHDILRGATEVIVTDGFTGNIVLKTIEGMSDTWLSSLSQAGQVFAKAYSLPLRALHRDIGMGSWAQRLDYSEYGGACLLGVNGNVIIAHGRSQARAIKNAIGLAKRTAEHNISQIIKEGSSD